MEKATKKLADAAYMWVKRGLAEDWEALEKAVRAYDKAVQKQINIEARQGKGGGVMGMTNEEKLAAIRRHIAKARAESPDGKTAWDRVEEHRLKFGHLPKGDKFCVRCHAMRGKRGV